jgi:hypothetical protein
MSLSREFENIDTLLGHRTETTGVDCFSLAVIKLERQMRRLFTYGVFQFSCFTEIDIPELREALVKQRYAYFDGFIRGFDLIHPRPISELIGASHTDLLQTVKKAIEYRNKIFHGQLTPDSLKTSDLLSIVESIRTWCRKLGESSEAYFGYSGFSNSFIKASNRAFVAGYRTNLTSIEEYEEFLLHNVKRPQN